MFEIKEQPAPQSTAPGEFSWPTQPIPVKPPQLVRNRITREELSNVTPESRKYCEALFNALDHPGGAYQPFGTKPTLRFPGLLGGATWSGASFDPASGLLYVNVNELGATGWVAGAGEKRAPWPKRFWDENEWPCQQPPWGKLMAIDLASGDIRWSVPLGIVEELAAKGLTNTGAPNLGGSIVSRLRAAIIVYGRVGPVPPGGMLNLPFDSSYCRLISSEGAARMLVLCGQ